MQASAEENLRECPNCFHPLGEEEEICPNCGHRYGEPVGPTARERCEKRLRVAQYAIQFSMIAVTLAAALLGRYLGNWWYALLGAALGLVATVIALFCFGLFRLKATSKFDKGREAEDASDSGDSRAD